MYLNTSVNMDNIIVVYVFTVYKHTTRFKKQEHILYVTDESQKVWNWFPDRLLTVKKQAPFNKAVYTETHATENGKLLRRFALSFN